MLRTTTVPLDRLLCDFSQTDEQGRYTTWDSRTNPDAPFSVYKGTYVRGEHLVFYDRAGLEVEVVIEGSPVQLFVARPLGVPSLPRLCFSR